MNQPSDNFMAEMLIKVLGAQFGDRGSTAAGTGVIAEELAVLGIEPSVVDGSGLSRADRTSPRDVVTLLSEHDADAAFTGSLAVAGRTGTIASRMRGTSAQDRCRAKTGTLHDVSALAGYCTTAGGNQVAFAFLMNYVSPWNARVLQDRMAVALAQLPAVAGASRFEQREQPGLVQHGNAEALGLLQLGARPPRPRPRSRSSSTPTR